MDDHPPFSEPSRVRIRGGERRVASAVRLRRPSVPVAEMEDYTTSDWDASSFGLFGEGADPAACPECGRTGFFGPRFVEPDVKCRSCRFCGFWQRTDSVPERHLPTSHDCADWPKISRAAYVWWVAPTIDFYECPFCNARVDVPLSIVPAPIEDIDHPWWKVPQQKPQQVYQRLWNNWTFSAGRTIL